MSLEHDVENELTEIFKRFGSPPTSQSSAGVVTTNSYIAGRDFRQINFHFSGSVDSDQICQACKVLQMELFP